MTPTVLATDDQTRYFSDKAVRALCYAPLIAFITPKSNEFAPIKFLSKK